MAIKSLSLENVEKIRQKTRDIGKQSFYEYCDSNGLSCEVSPDLKTAAKCFVTTPSNMAFADADFSETIILKKCKKELCEKSIAYEQAIAKDYKCEDEVQKAILYAASNERVKMTAVFPSMIAILTKMKKLGQSIQVCKEKFCPVCSKRQCLDIRNFASNGETFKPVERLPKDEPCLLIEGYQYPDSFLKLKKALNEDDAATEISRERKGCCECKEKITQPDIPDDIVDAVLSCSAQHPQYITGEDIKFDRESILEKDFKMRKKINGFGISDMSVFFINHIYASKPK